MRHLLFFGLASACGGLARYGLSTLVGHALPGLFPWGIFITNVLGCFLFGAIWALAALFHILDDATRSILLTGFMGAFTTFSTFIFDSQNLLHQGEWLALTANVAGQVVLGFLAMLLGIKVSSWALAALI